MDPQSSARGVALLREALTHDEGGRRPEAEAAAHTALALFTSAEDRTGQAAAHQLLAELTDGPLGAAHLDRAVALRRDTGDTEGLVVALELRVARAGAERDLAGAAAALRDLLDVRAEGSDRAAELRTRDALVSALLELGDLEDATRAAGDAGALQARVLLEQGDVAGALEAARAARVAAEAEGLQPAIVLALHQLGRAIDRGGDLAEGRRLLTAALNGVLVLQDDEKKASILEDLADLETRDGRIDAALDRLGQAARAHRSAGAAQAEIGAWHRYVQLADRTNHGSAGLDGARALARAAVDSDDEAAGPALHALGVRYYRLGDVAGAVKAFRDLVAHVEEGDRAVARVMLGQALVAAGAVAEARLELHAALPGLDPEGAQQVRALLAGLQ